MDAEVRAQLIAAADRAVENYDSGAEPYRSVGEAVIDALQIEQAGTFDGFNLYGTPFPEDEPIDGAPVFTLGVLSLTEGDHG